MSIRVPSKRLLLWSIAVDLLFTAAVTYTPLLRTSSIASLSADQLAVADRRVGAEALVRRIGRHRDQGRVAALP